jgi:hypothetical protein
VVSRELTRRGVALPALAAIEMVVVVAVAVAYGTDGPVHVALALACAPLAVGLTWSLADGLAGRRFADAAATVYVLLPALGTLYAFSTYRSAFMHQAIPDLVGLRATPWFVLGLALAAFAVFRWSAFVYLAPGVAMLVYGYGDLSGIRIGLHETAWSITMLIWLPIAGVLGAMRRSWLRATALAAWLAFAVGHAARQGYDGGAFWQSLSIAAPGIAVLLTSLWLLVPPLRATPSASRAH